MSFYKLLLSGIILLFSSLVFAKRLPPVEVAPLIMDDIEYSVERWGWQNGTDQNGGYIIATDLKSGDRLWGKQVYKMSYQPLLERDIQDVFITSIQASKDKKCLLITNENGAVFKLVLKDLLVVAKQPENAAL